MGCKYCGMDKIDINGNIGVTNHITINNFNILVSIWGDGVDIGLFQEDKDLGECVMYINYCPMCGCRLKKE